MRPSNQSYFHTPQQGTPWWQPSTALEVRSARVNSPILVMWKHPEREKTLTSPLHDVHFDHLVKSILTSHPQSRATLQWLYSVESLHALVTTHALVTIHCAVYFGRTSTLRCVQSFPEQCAGLLHLLRISGSLYTDAEQVAFAPHQWLAAIH